LKLLIQYSDGNKNGLKETDLIVEPSVLNADRNKKLTGAE
jgi:hypothetical protein